jgi:hypothetical protein
VEVSCAGPDLFLSPQCGGCDLSLGRVHMCNCLSRQCSRCKAACRQCVVMVQGGSAVLSCKAWHSCLSVFSCVLAIRTCHTEDAPLCVSSGVCVLFWLDYTAVTCECIQEWHVPSAAVGLGPCFGSPCYTACKHGYVGCMLYNVRTADGFPSLGCLAGDGQCALWPRCTA